MKAVTLVKSYSKVSDFKAEFLEYREDVPIPDLSDEYDLVVKVHACGLNPVDYKVSPFGIGTVPRVIGFDIAGTVHKVAPSNTKFKVGDHVYFMGPLKAHGGFAEYTVVHSRGVAHIPDGISFVDAASTPIAGWTAYKALYDKVRIKAGETVLITAGAGGVGGYAIQLAKLVGANIITTCSARNFDYVKHLGAHHVIDYNSEDIHKRVLEITGGRGVDIWVDVLSTASAELGLKCLAFGGSLVVISANPNTALADLFTSQKSVHEIFLAGAWTADLKAQEDLGRIAREFIQLVHDKKLQLLPIEIVPLKGVPEALARLLDGHVKGKLVTKILD